MKKLLALLCVSFVLLGYETEARVSSSRSSVSRSSVSRSSASRVRVSNPRPAPKVHKATVKSPTYKSSSTINKSSNVNVNKNTTVNKKNVTVNKTIINNNNSGYRSSNDGFFTGMLMGNLLSRPSTTVVNPVGYHGNSDVVYVDNNDEVQMIGNKTIVRKRLTFTEFFVFLLIVVGVIGSAIYLLRRED